jgi:hypothetical protein
MAKFVWVPFLTLICANASAAGLLSNRSDCKSKDGIWLEQKIPAPLVSPVPGQHHPILPAKVKEFVDAGICLDPSKSHEFGALNENKNAASSRELTDFVTGAKIQGKDLFIGGPEVEICNFGSTPMHHGGPAGASGGAPNTIAADECKLVYPLGWKDQWYQGRGPRRFAVTGIWTPADVAIAEKAHKERLDAEWMDDPANPGKRIPKPVDTGTYRMGIDENGKPKWMTLEEYDRMKKVTAKKKKGGTKSSGTHGTKSSGKSKKSATGAN